MGVGTILEANEIIVLSAETKGLKGFLEGSVNHLVSLCHNCRHQVEQESGIGM